MYKENLLNCYFHCVFCIKIDNKWKYVRVCVQTTGTLYYTGIPHSLKQKKKLEYKFARNIINLP